jgi:hypothetical protein
MELDRFGSAITRTEFRDTMATSSSISPTPMDWERCDALITPTAPTTAALAGPAPVAR